MFQEPDMFKSPNFLSARIFGMYKNTPVVAASAISWIFDDIYDAIPLYEGASIEDVFDRVKDKIFSLKEEIKKTYRCEKVYLYMDIDSNTHIDKWSRYSGLTYSEIDDEWYSDGEENRSSKMTIGEAFPYFSENIIKGETLNEISPPLSGEEINRLRKKKIEERNSNDESQTSKRTLRMKR